jgi:hypothetical protein
MLEIICSARSAPTAAQREEANLQQIVLEAKVSDTAHYSPGPGWWRDAKWRDFLDAKWEDLSIDDSVTPAAPQFSVGGLIGLAVAILIVPVAALGIFSWNCLGASAPPPSVTVAGRVLGDTISDAGSKTLAGGLLAFWGQLSRE